MNDFAAFGAIFRAALRLDPKVYTLVPLTAQGLWVAIAIVLLACVSAATGQSIVLFLNRVRPRRFGLALTIGVLSNLAGYGVWTLTIWLAGRLLFASDPGLRTVAGVVGLAYAPQVFSFFVLVPFLGNGIGVLLTLWSMAAIVLAIHMGFDLPAWQAVTLAAVGWLLLQVLYRTIGRPVLRVQHWVAGRAAGVKLVVRPGDESQLRRRTLPTWYMQLESWRPRPLVQHEPPPAAGDPTNA